MAWWNNIQLPNWVNFDKPQPPRANVRNTITFEQQLQRVRQDAQKFNIAVEAAESPRYPNRFLLMQMYQQIVLDGQVSGVMLQRKSKVLSQKFNILNSAGEVDYEKTKLFQKKWFYDFSSMALDSIYWGFSLVQFGPIKNDQFIYTELVPRIYVVPEFSLVRSNTATVIDGVKFTEKPYSNWCIGVGEKYDLGLLMKLAPYVIWKKNAMAAWAEFTEIFGVPMRTVKTDVRDELTRKNAENMLKNMGIATWAVLDLNDEFQLHETSRSDAYQVFDKLVERCNSEISKIILGQTGTTDEKAYSGSSKVHESVADMVAQQDLRMMEFVVSNQLFPMMQSLGFDLSGYTFEYDRSETLSIQDQAKIDASFMPYVKFDKEYLEHRYGIELIETPHEEAAEDESEQVSNITKKLKNIYK